MNGAELIAAERLRQTQIGWTREHDDEHHDDESLAVVASFLARPTGQEQAVSGWGRTLRAKKLDRVEQLAVAGALIAAEIDRLQAEAGWRLTVDLAEIRARLAGERGPKPWKDGDPRCHCSPCDACDGFFRTEDIRAHQLECWAEHAREDLGRLLDEVDRLATLEQENHTALYGEAIMLVRGHLKRAGIERAFVDDGACVAANEILKLRTEVDRLTTEIALLVGPTRAPAGGAE